MDNIIHVNNSGYCGTLSPTSDDYPQGIITIISLFYCQTHTIQVRFPQKMWINQFRDENTTSVLNYSNFH